MSGNSLLPVPRFATGTVGVFTDRNPRPSESVDRRSGLTTSRLA